MVPDVPNPAFEPAIFHAMPIIDYLHKVVIFGAFPGCLRMVSGVGSRSPSGDVSRGCRRAAWEHSESVSKAF